MWDYRKANIESIQRPVKSVNWESLFNSKTVNKQFSIFNGTTISFLILFPTNWLHLMTVTLHG